MLCWCDIVQASTQEMLPSDVKTYQPALLELFFTALDYRTQHSSDKVSHLNCGLHTRFGSSNTRCGKSDMRMRCGRRLVSPSLSSPSLPSPSLSPLPFPPLPSTSLPSPPLPSPPLPSLPLPSPPLPFPPLPSLPLLPQLLPPQPMDQVAAVEERCVSLFGSLVLKMSEATFRPAFLKVGPSMWACRMVW